MAKVRIHQKPAGIPANTSVFAVEILQNNVWYTRKVSWETLKGLIAGAESLVFDAGTLTFTTPDGIAHQVLSVDSEVIPNSANPVSGGAVNAALAGKQDTLTFDQTPTDGSTNPVESNGIYDALAGKQDTLTFDSTPTDGSTNPVTSQGIYEAISAVTSGIDWKESVATYADIATTYPNPEDGWTVTTLDDDHTYRYNGTAWVDLFSLITLATSTKDGLMSSADFTKLAGIEAEANKTTDEDITDVVVDLTDMQQTASANPITLETKQAGLAKSFVVSFGPIQDLHGYSNPWPGGAGKNKFNDTIGTHTINANTDVTLLIGSVDLVADITYTISCKQTPNTVTWVRNLLAIKKQGTTSIIYNSLGSGDTIRPMTYTPSETATFDILVWGHTLSADTTYSDFQVEVGTQATTFAPYSNICPISGRTEASVTRTGKNKAPINDFTVTRGTVETFSPNLPSGTYSISFNATRTGSDSRASSCRLIYDDDTNYEFSFSPSGAVKKENITATKPIKSLYMYSIGGSYSDSGNFTLTISNFQIEEGSTASEYEPYRSPETKTKEFGQTVYGGSLDLNSGELTIEWGYTKLSDMPSSRWNKLSASNTYYMIKSYSIPLAKTVVEGGKYPISDKYIYQYRGTMENNSMRLSDALYIRDDRFTTLADWLSYISNTDAEICYELETPTTIQLSPEALTLLKGLNVISTDGDTVQVEFSDIPVGDYSVLLDYVKSLEDRIKALEGGN